MIPIQLTLRNFLSYRDTAELDLTGLHLACISGSNGVGKSTILEAMTWALFGKSRVKSDDDIVNRDAAAKGQAAEVSFVFELEGAVYRVIRRKAPRKTTELEFNVRGADVAGDRWQVKTEARVRDTEREIEKLLRMDYDVFTNASFLLQGKADEFTANSPARRKQILAEILGVQRWDEYKDLATEHRKEVQVEVMAVDRQIGEAEAELAREEEYAQALERAALQVRMATAERDRQDALVSAALQNKALADQQRESLRRIAAELADHEAEIRRIENTIAQQRYELAGYRDLLDRREMIVAAFETWQNVIAESVAWQGKAEEYDAISREMVPLDLAVARAESQLQQQVQSLQAERVKVEQAAAELISLQTVLSSHESQRQDILAKLAGLGESQSEWQAARDRRQALEYERKLYQQELSQLRGQAEEIATLRKEREQVDANLQDSSRSLEKAQDILKGLAGKRVLLEESRAKLAGLEADRKHWHAEMNDLKNRMNMLSSEEREDCPLCGQPLTAEHRRHAIEQLETQGKERATLYRGAAPVTEALQREIGELDEALRGQVAWEKKRDDYQMAFSRVQERLKNIDNVLVAWQEGNKDERLAELDRKLADQSEWTALNERIERLQAAADEARQQDQILRQIETQITHDKARCEGLERIRDEWGSRGQPALEEAERRLAQGDFARIERAALAEMKTRQATIAYDAVAHTAVRSRLSQLSGASEDYQQLQRAEAAVKPLAESLAELTRQQERMAAKAGEFQRQRHESELQLQMLEAGMIDLRAAEFELQRLREEVVAASRAEGGARQRVEVLTVRREDHKQLTARKTALARQISLLKQLEEACGHNGVQALLIDAALPEIQAYANDLLYRLSGGDMDVRLKTQRAAKSKDSLIETLDIAIADSFGERPYENYSGGEKFRVNFAIRLALSQVLARRAGARLRTLVIDEGFGSQDPEGRQRLVEAINTVQDEFACILVITHIEELRDKFPARIDVEKTPAGSRFSVVTP